MPKSSNDSTTVFKADITDFTRAMQEAKRYVRMAAAEFKEASSGLGKWQTSTEGLTAKVTQLTKTLTGQKRQLEALEIQYKDVAKEQGENSRGAQELKIKIDNTKAAIKNTEQALDQYENELNAVTGETKKTAKETNDLSTSTDKLRQKIKEQESALQTLKKKYTDLQVEEKGTSKESQSLEKEIKDLSIELNKNKKKLNKAEDAADDLSNTMERTSDGFTIAKGVLADLVADGIRRVIEGMKELASATFEAGKNFEVQMSRVEAIAGATGDQVKQLNDKAKEMGATTKFTATEAGEAFEYMAMAGWKTDEMLEGIEGTMHLAAASGEELGQVSDIVTDALTAMGYGAKDAGKFADVLASAATNSNTNIKLMGETFKYVAPILGSMGYNMEDAAIQIGLMANNGIKASQAGTALRSIITRLSTNAGASKNKLGALEVLTEKLGVQFYNAEGKARPLNKVIGEAREAWKGLADEQKTAYAKQIAGQYAMSGWLALMNSAPKDVNKLTKAIEHSSGAAEEMANVMNDNVGGQLTILKSKIEGIMIKVFNKASYAMLNGIHSISDALDTVNLDKVGKSVESGVKNTVNFFTWIIHNGGTIKTILKTIAATIATIFILDKIGAFILLIQKLVVQFKTLSAVMVALKATNIGTAITALISPVGLATIAIGGLITVIALLNKRSKDIYNSYKSLNEIEQENTYNVDRLSDSYKNLKESMDETISGTNEEFNRYEKLKKEYNSLIDKNGKIKEGYEDRANFILNKLAKAMGVERSEIDKLINKNGKLGKKIDEVMAKKKAEILLNANEDEYAEAIRKQEKAYDAYLAKQKDVSKNEKELAKAEDELRKLRIEQNDMLHKYGTDFGLYNMKIADAQDKVSGLKDKLKEQKQSLKDAKDAWVGYNKTISLMDNLTMAVESGSMKKINSAIRDLSNGLITFADADRKTLENQLTTAQAKLKELEKAYADGTSGITKKSVNNMRDLVEKSKVELQKFDLSELEKKAEKAGIKIPENIQKGIDTGKTNTSAAIKQLQDLITFDALVKKAKKAGVDVPKEIALGVNSGKNNPAKAIEEVNNLIEKEAKKKKGLKKAGQDKTDAVADGVKNKKKNAENAGKEVSGSVKKGADSGKDDMKKAGDSSSQMYISAVDSDTNKKKANSAGKELAKQAKKGADTKDETTNSETSGSNFGEGFWKGIGNWFSKVWERGKALAKKALGGLKEGQDEGSPSELTKKSGIFFGQGYKLGIASMTKSVAKTAMNMGVQAVISLKKAQQEGSPSKLAYKSGVNFVKDYINGIVSMQSDLVMTAKDLVGAVTKELLKLENFNFSTVSSNASQVFSNVISDQLDYIMDKINYQNELKLESFDTEIDKIQSELDSKVTALESSRDKEISRLESLRDKLIKDTESERDKIIKDIENNRDKQVKALESKQNKTKKASEKKKLAAQIKTIKENASKEIKVQKENSNKLIAGIKNNYENQIKAAKNNSEKAINNTKDQYNKLIAKQQEFKEAYQKASAAMISELSEALNAYQTKAQQLIDDTINGITDTYQKRYDELINKQDNLISKLKSAGNLFEVSGAGVMTINDIKAQTQQIKDYTSKLKEIKDKVSSDLFDQIATYDMKEGSAFIDSLLELSDAELKAYSDAFDEKMSLSESLSEDLYKEDFDKVASDYEIAIKEAFDDLPETLEELGVQTMLGFISGLEQNTNYMESTIRTIVKGIVNTFKDQLDMHSPSGVTEALGEFTGKDFGNGLKNTIGYVKKSVSSIIDEVKTPLENINPSINRLKSSVNDSSSAGITNNSNVVNNYNLVQNNSSPKSLSALETYQARRRQIAMMKAATQNA